MRVRGLELGLGLSGSGVRDGDSAARVRVGVRDSAIRRRG